MAFSVFTIALVIILASKSYKKLVLMNLHGLLQTYCSCHIKVCNYMSDYHIKTKVIVSEIARTISGNISLRLYPSARAV